MADLSITAANIDYTNAGLAFYDPNITAGVALTAAQCVYLTSSNTIALCNTTTSTLADCLGLVVGSAIAAGNQLIVARTGQTVTGMPTLVAGQKYYVSGTGGTHASSAAGGICLYSELTTGEYVCELGTALTTAILEIDIKLVKNNGTAITKA